MEEQVLFNVLLQTDKGFGEKAAPSTEYFKSLVNTGFIKDEWGGAKLTELGRNTLERLRSKFQKW